MSCFGTSASGTAADFAEALMPALLFLEQRNLDHEPRHFRFQLQLVDPGAGGLAALHHQLPLAEDGEEVAGRVGAGGLERSLERRLPLLVGSLDADLALLQLLAQRGSLLIGFVPFDPAQHRHQRREEGKEGEERDERPLEQDC